MSFIIVSLLALLISLSTSSDAQVDAKPLNQNQVKFRRLPPKEFSAALGSSITIECEAGGSPPPSIHWLKNGKRILQNGDGWDENHLEDGQQAIQIDDANRIALSSTRSRLFIDCADFKDEAIYTCVAENSYSRISSNTKLNLIKPLPAQLVSGPASENDLLSGAMDDVAALELAAVNAQQEQQQADKSLSAIPQCLSRRNSRSAAGTEPARIHMWTHNIVEIMKNDVILYCRSNVRKQQAAETQQQSQLELIPTTTSNLNAKLSKLLPTSASSSSSSSSLEQQQQQQQQQENNNNNNNNNKGTSSVSWTTPDNKQISLDQKDKYEILETGDLLIKDLRWTDMGSYACTVSDEQSIDSVSTFVYPASPKAKSKRALLSSRF